MNKIIHIKSLLWFFLSVGSCLILSAYAQGNTDAVDRILAKIARIPLTSSLKVSVTVQGDVATLQAEVSSEEQARLLIAIATSIPGMREVDVTQLTLPNHQPLPYNTILIGKILGTYVREQVFVARDVDSLPIQIEISNQRIFLRGVLDAKMQLVAAINIARRISNMQIISLLSVKSETVRISP